MEDRQLIHEFATTGSERAFHDLVERHLNLVQSLAARLLRDDHLAQEVAQAVFIILARKASSLPRNVILAGWLYRTTRFVAARALRSEQRRQHREQEAFLMQQTSPSNNSWERLAPMLDEAIEQLGKTDRDAVLLRFFHGQPFNQIGSNLGISEDAARKRIARSLEKFRTFFARRGVTISAAVLAAMLAEQCAKAAPSATLRDTITSKSLAQTTAGAAGLPALVKETLNVWAWSRAKLAMGLGAAAIVTALFFVEGMPAIRKFSSVAPNQNNTAPATNVAADSNAAPASSNLALHISFQVVDGGTGTGVAGSQVFVVSARDQDAIDMRTNLVSDAAGRCDVPLVFSNAQFVAIGALADGYEQRCIVLGGQNQAIPAQATLKLSRGSSISGVVQDENGAPVTSANVYVQFYGTGDSSEREFQRERPGFPADNLPVARTDASGYWTFASAPATNGDFYIAIKHPDFAPADFQNDGNENAAASSNPGHLLKLDDLHAGKAVMVLKRGVGVRGVVTDEQHAPISGAIISFGEYSNETNPKTETAADGSFVVNGLALGAGHITVTAKNYAPQRVSVEVRANATPVNIQLKAGGILRVLVVDQSGAGVSHARVQLQGWLGNNTLDWGEFTDYQGHAEWDSAPRETLDLCVIKDGYLYSRQNLIVADGAEHTITLRPQLAVTGSVTDANTKQPIPSFKVIPGSEESYWDRSELAKGTNGQYRLVIRENRKPLQVRFEADGYEPAVSDPLPAKSTNLTCDMQLKKDDPQNAVRGVALLPDGSPASGARLALCTAEKGVTLSHLTFSSQRESIVVDADADGRFAFPPDKAPTAVAAVHTQGFARVPVDPANHQMTVQLEPWGRIEGVLKRTGEPVTTQQIVAQYDSSPVVDGRQSFALEFGSFTTKTDEQGNFVFDQVPPGRLKLYLHLGPGIPFALQTPIEVKGGATVNAQVGGNGRALKGRFVLSDSSRTVDWPGQVHFASIHTKMPRPQIQRGMSPAEIRKIWADYAKSDEYRSRLRDARNFPLVVHSDGFFTVEDAAPGTYELRATVYAEPLNHGLTPTGDKPLGVANQEVVVPELAADQSSDPIDIGNVTVKIWRGQ
jgi:RNA polymerase sigma factor (sigma-70 family)